MTCASTPSPSPDTTTSATTPTAVGVCMFDFGSIRLARRRHLLQRRMVPARDGVCRVTEPAITTSATSAPPTTAVGVCMFDFGSIRLARRWHLLQRWLVPARDGVRLHTDTDTAPAASTVGQCLYDTGSVRLAWGRDLLQRRVVPARDGLQGILTRLGGARRTVKRAANV